MGQAEWGVQIHERLRCTQYQISAVSELLVKPGNGPSPRRSVKIDHHVAAKNDVKVTEDVIALYIRQVKAAEAQHHPQFFVDQPRAILFLEIANTLIFVGGSERILLIQPFARLGDDAL
jgi:hypothetical protein